MRILIVDDEAYMLPLLKPAFEATGEVVLEQVETINKALESVRMKAPDLVLLDMRLAKEDGLALLYRLRQECIDVPVIIMSTIQIQPSLERVVKAECPNLLGSLVKTPDPVEMNLGVRNMLHATKA